MKTTSSPQFHVGKRDWIRSFIVAVITPVFTVAFQSLNEGHLTFDWKAMGVTAIIAALSYITKNFLEPAKIIVSNVGQDTAKEIKTGAAEVKIETSNNATVIGG